MNPASARRGALLGVLVAVLLGATLTPSLGASVQARPVALHTERASAPVDPGVTAPESGRGIASESITFIDPTRATPARGSVPATDERILRTVIRRPRRWTGRLALVVFLHGWNSNPSVYEPLLDAWAEAGYFVAAPVIPSSSDWLPGSAVSDYAEQAEDASFLITALFARFGSVLDAGRIAVAGHSDGATDVALLALNPRFADHRIAAYLSLSGDIPSDVGGPWDASTPGSLLVSVGSRDEYGLYPYATGEFDAAKMHKAMVVVPGGDHLGIYVGTSEAALAMRAATVRFLALALGKDPPGSAGLAAALRSVGPSSFQVIAAPS